jgi:hypothetical protein
VMGWRSNGDGVHVTKSWSVSRLFLRTQDDAMYITSGEGAHSHYDRIITWNDANGWSFKFSAGGGDAEFSTLTNSDVLYHRNSWAYGEGGIFCYRSSVQNGVMSGLVIENIQIEDPLPTFPVFILRVPTLVNKRREERRGPFRNVPQHYLCKYRRHQFLHHAAYAAREAVATRASEINISNVRFVNITIGGFGLAEVIREDSMFNLSTDVPGSLVNVTVDGKLVAG